jgi:haloacetate dehalogenase
MCEDYRASATIDLDHDRTDIASGKKLQMPVKVLWGEHGVVAHNFDVLALWRERASNVDGQTLPCGHYIAEEEPGELLAHAHHFFTS